LTPQWVKLRERDVDLVYGQGITGPVLKTFFTDRVKLGYTDMAFGGHHYLDGKLVAKVAGNEATEGLLTPNYCYMVNDMDQPGVKLARDLAAKYRPNYEPNYMYMSGMMWGDWLVEAMRRAIIAKGSVDITDKDLLAGFLSMEGFVGQGFTKACGGPINENDRQIASWLRIHEVQKGVSVPVADWVKVDIKAIAPPEFRNLFD